MGWRLGGKGASGRGPSGRIEEHGLHIWMGFYENAFRLMRECYAELARDPGDRDVADWRDAFIPENAIGVSAPSARRRLAQLVGVLSRRAGPARRSVGRGELLSAAPLHLAGRSTCCER